jgi:AraC-like DNA-binding protein
MIKFLCAFQSFFALLILPNDKHHQDIRLFLLVFMGFAILSFSQGTDIFIVRPIIILFFVFCLSVMIYLFVRLQFTARTSYSKSDMLYLSPILICLVLIEYDSAALALGIGGQTIFMFLTLHLYWKWFKNPQKRAINHQVSSLVWLILLAIQIHSIYFLGTLNNFNDPLQTLVKYTSWLLNLFIINFWLFKLVTAKNNTFSFFHPKTDTCEDLDNGPQDDFLSNIFEDLHKTVVSQGLYKTHRISLLDISQKTGFNVRDISRAINVYNQTSFTDYINHLRIDSVKRSFMQDARQNIKILDIGLNSGFSSKTTFNTAFKKFSGCTPSDFVNRMGQQISAK